MKDSISIIFKPTDMATPSFNCGASSSLCDCSTHSCPVVLPPRTDELLRLLDMAKPDEDDEHDCPQDGHGTMSLHRRTFADKSTKKATNKTTANKKKQASLQHLQNHGGCRRRKVYQYLTANQEPSTSQTKHMSKEIATTKNSTQQEQSCYHDIHIPQKKFMASSSRTIVGKSLKNDDSLFTRRQLPRIDSNRALGDLDLQEVKSRTSMALAA